MDVASGSATGRPAPPWSRVDALHLIALFVCAGIYAFYLHHIAAVAAMPPQADAGSHTLWAVHIYQRFADGPLRAAETFIYAGGGYPTVLYSMTALLFAGPPSPEALPRALHLVLVTSLLVGWPLARTLWGRAPAWAWTFLFALSPYVVGYSSHYFLDLPLTSSVGAGILALLYAQRFDRVGPGLLFGVVAGLGMLMKWAWLFFLGPPFLVCAALVIVRAARARQIGITPLLVTLAVVGLVGLGFRVGWLWAPRPGGPGAPVETLYFGVVGACLAVAVALVVWARYARAAAGTRGLFAALAGGIMVAGPWYFLGIRELWSLFELHSDIHADRSQPLSFYLAENVDSWLAFFPFIAFWTGGAILLLPLAWRSARLDGALALLGALSGWYCISVTVAPDPRYVLPALPLAAAVLAAALTALPNLARWGVAALAFGGALVALQPTDGSEGAGGVQQRGGNPDVTASVRVLGQRVEVLRDPSYLDFTGFNQALEALRAECGRSCDVVVRSREDHWVQGRTFEASGELVGLSGVKWWMSTTTQDDPRPWLPKDVGRQPLLLVMQPCSFHPGERSDVEAWRASVLAVLGGHLDPVGAFPLPGGCEMYIDRVVVDSHPAGAQVPPPLP